MRIPSLTEIRKKAKESSDRRKVKNIYDLADKQRKALLKKEGAAVRRMVGAYSFAEKRIRAKLDLLIARIKQAQAAGIELSPAWLFQQSRYIELLDTIANELAKYGAVATDVTKGQQSASLAMGLEHTRQLARAAGLNVGWKMLPKAALENLVGFLVDGSPLRDIFAALGPDAIRDARQVLTAGFAAGENPRKIARSLRKVVTLTKKRSVLIARTESLRAYRTAAQQNYAANSNVVLAGRWSSSRDGRTCYLCLAKDGSVVPHGSYMPVHPGCRCAVVPVVKFLEVDRGTGEEWLAKQPEGVQKRRLGPARYALWKSGKITMQDMVAVKYHPRWGNSIKAVSLKQIDYNLAMGIKAPDAWRNVRAQ